MLPAQMSSLNWPQQIGQDSESKSIMKINFKHIATINGLGAKSLLNGASNQSKIEGSGSQKFAYLDPY